MNENRNNLPMNPAQLRQRERLEQKNKAVEKMQRQQEVLERENKEKHSGCAKDAAADQGAQP